jgi:choline dehydrogenase-like flavoprotein
LPTDCFLIVSTSLTAIDHEDGFALRWLLRQQHVPVDPPAGYAPRMNWRVTLPITLNEQTRGVALAKEIVKYYARRRGVLSLAAALVFGFVRTRPELEVPDVQLLFTHASYSDPQVRALDRTPGMTVTLYQCRPESTGSIHIKSPIRPQRRPSDRITSPTSWTGVPSSPA